MVMSHRLCSGIILIIICVFICGLGHVGISVFNIPLLNYFIFYILYYFAAKRFYVVELFNCLHNFVISETAFA